MSSVPAKLALGLSALALLGCGDTGRAYVDVPLYVRGTEARAVSLAGGTLTLNEAQISLGPLYLCATQSAESALCETAVAERLDVLLIDALDPQATRTGQLAAVTGSVRSAFFDYGMSWLLTKPKPAYLASASLGHGASLGFSALLDDGSALNVRAEIDIPPLAPGDAAVNGRKTEQTIATEPPALTLVLDPNAWLSRIRIEDLRALDDDGDGNITLSPDTQAYEAIVQGMTARFPPTFVWGEVEEGDQAP